MGEKTKESSMFSKEKGKSKWEEDNQKEEEEAEGNNVEMA